MGFKSLLEGATSEALMEDNLELNLAVVDAIRAHELPHKDAFSAIRQRLKAKNPNVVLRTLSLLEMVVKNCGAQMQCLVAQKDFMEQMRAVVNSDTPLVRKKALELMQMWAHAFKDEPTYRIVPDTVSSLRAAGFEFPPFNPNATTMFVAEKAPDWVEGEKCFKCQSPFTLFNRRHHCRNCGQIFCQTCSSKTAMLPHYAIETPVRVCDTCADRLKAGVAGPAQAAPPPPPASTDDPTDLLALQRRLLRGEATEDELMRALSKDTAAGPPQRSPEQEARLKEEEELQLAMALSMSEAQSKPRVGAAATAPAPRREPAPRPAETLYPSMPSAPAEDAVARYPAIRAQTSTSSVSSKASAGQGGPSPAPAASGTSGEDPLASFLSTLRLLEQRMDAAAQPGRHLSNDPAAQTLYRSLLTLHRDVLTQLDTATRREAKFLEIQSKQLDIDTARAQAEAEARAYAERLQQQQREQELLAKIQLEQKMKLLEAQQREQLEYQRAMAQSHLVPGASVPLPAAYPPQAVYPPRAQLSGGPPTAYAPPPAQAPLPPGPAGPAYAPAYAASPAPPPPPAPQQFASPPVYQPVPAAAPAPLQPLNASMYGQPTAQPYTPPHAVPPPAPVPSGPAQAPPYGGYPGMQPPPPPGPPQSSQVPPAYGPGFPQQSAVPSASYPPPYGAPAGAPPAPATAELISFD